MTGRTHTGSKPTTSWVDKVVDWLVRPVPQKPTRDVLVVEDDHSVGAVLRINLELEGHDVEVARDLRQARDLVTRRPPSLVILDMNLPDGTGFEFLRHLRDDLKLEVPVIILSGFKQEEAIVRALEWGATDYMIKPFSPRELLARVHKIRQAQGDVA